MSNPRLILGLLLPILLLWGQDAEENILGRARALVKANHSDRALLLLEDHLFKNERDTDARVLYGLILSWESSYEAGRKALEAVLRDDPDYKDARLALINLETWSGHPERSVELATAGLEFRPADTDYREALAKANQKLIGLSTMPAGKSQPPQVRGESHANSSEASWEFGVERNQIFFSDHRSSWNEESVNFSRNLNAGWLTARFSNAHEYGVRDNFAEIEMYPRIARGTYGFVNAGVSTNAQLYAHRRLAGEVFQSLPHGFEASAGFRSYRFVNNVNMFTGSVAKYFGNWWLSARTYISPDKSGASRSFQFSARRYWRDADHYIGFRGGIGASPFEVRSINETGILESESMGFEMLWKLRNRFRMRLSAGIAREDRISLVQLWQYSTDCTLYYRF